MPSSSTHHLTNRTSINRTLKTVFNVEVHFTDVKENKKEEDEERSNTLILIDDVSFWVGL